MQISVTLQNTTGTGAILYLIIGHVLGSSDTEYMHIWADDSNQAIAVFRDEQLAQYEDTDADEVFVDCVTEIGRKPAPAELDEDEIADFMLQRIEDGNLALEDIPVRLARYGLMNPEQFCAEMQERMESGT